MASTGRARFTAHFTDAQKEAIMRSALVEGRTVADTIRAAKAGELGMPAFDIGRYAYQLVRDGRDRYEGQNDEALHRSIDDELHALEIAALSHARAIRRRLKGDGTDNPDSIAKAAQGLSATRKARREANSAQKGAKPKATPGYNQPPERPKDDPLTNLLAMAEGAPKSGSLARAQRDAPSPSPAQAA